MFKVFKTELCCSSVEALKLAKKYKVDRVELCQHLEEGGLTPSYGLFNFAKELNLPVHVLIRPRSGGFTYTEDEKSVILRDIDFFTKNGADGIVVGCLNENFTLDEDFLNCINIHEKDIEFTFHRAFDEIVHWKNSVDILISHNFRRILSSGRTKNINYSIQNFNEMINYANEKIEFMPGGGVNAVNVIELIQNLKISSIHFSATTKLINDDESVFSTSRLIIDEKKLDRILNSIRMALDKR